MSFQGFVAVAHVKLCCEDWKGFIPPKKNQQRYQKMMVFRDVSWVSNMAILIYVCFASGE